MNNEPKNHHYIPQFILRNFSFGKGHVFYYIKKKGKIEERNTESVFREFNLYRDEVFNKDNPTKIEKDFSKYESEISVLINKKLLKNNEIILSKEEYESIKFFFALMKIRSSDLKSFFDDDNIMDPLTRQMYIDENNGDLNLSNYWIKNLGLLVNCRSYQEVEDNKDISDIVKLFIRRDTQGINGLYMVLLETRGNEPFILSDSYPFKLTTNDVLLNAYQPYQIFPLSPFRILILVSSNIESIGYLDLGLFDKKQLKEPKLINNNYQIKVNKIYEDKVHEINERMILDCNKGFIVTKELKEKLYD